MSSTYPIGNEATVEEPRIEHNSDIVDEVAERELALAPSVEQEIQGRIDYADDVEYENRLFGQTLEEEERLAAYEWEIERTRVRWDRRQDSDREVRCRMDVEARNEARRIAFAERAGSVDRWQDPAERDPREQVSRRDLAAINREAGRVSETLGGWSRAAVSRLIAERVAEGYEVCEAVLQTVDVLQTDPGSVVPIGRIGEVRSREANVEGTVVELWEPSHPKIAQVGLLEDDTGRTKVTSWKKSEQPRFEKGDQLRIRDAAKSWYQGRCSIALTGRTAVSIVVD